MWPGNHGVDRAVQRRVTAAHELVELIAANAVDEEAEDREVFPGRDVGAKRFDVALLVGPAKRV